MDPRKQIAEIDQQIDEVLRNLQWLERENPIDEMDAGSWHAAWDKHPSLHAHFSSLGRQRGIAQLERDKLDEREYRAAKRRLRAVTPPLRQCPTCGTFTRNLSAA